MKNLLTQNAKLKQTSDALGVRVFNFGIPAYKSVSGKVICPMADECVKFCYARKGAYRWSNVASVFEERYEATKRDDFVEVMSAEIKKKRPDYIRVHDSGDYYSPAYIRKWLEIARQHPEIRFYSYTNMVKLFKNLDLPENYDIIFSDSGKQKDLIDKKKDRHSKIFASATELYTSGYINASKVDLMATKWYNPWNKKVGLNFH